MLIDNCTFNNCNPAGIIMKTTDRALEEELVKSFMNAVEIMKRISRSGIILSNHQRLQIMDYLGERRKKHRPKITIDELCQSRK